MATVSFGSFSKRRNSTKKPLSLPDQRTVTLKDSCSQDRPVFICQGNNFNYNYCIWDSKYYFIDEVISLMVHAYVSSEIKQAVEIEPLEEVVDYIVAKVKKNHIKRLQKGICTVDLGYVLSDVLNNFERISDHCSNIGLSILESEIGDNFDSHEYINNLRSADSPEFKKRYAEYKEKYSI